MTNDVRGNVNGAVAVVMILRALIMIMVIRYKRCRCVVVKVSAVPGRSAKYGQQRNQRQNGTAQNRPGSRIYHPF